MRLVLNFRNERSKKLIETVYKDGHVISSEDVLEKVFELFSTEANVDAGVKLAKEIKLNIPKDWYELSLKKSVEIGDLKTASQSLEVLDREFTQKETDLIIEMLVLRGDMSSFHYLENFSDNTFNLAVWQHVFLIRVVRKIWEKKFNQKSPQSSLLNFSKDFKEIFTQFDITVIREIYFSPIKRLFKLFDNATLSQFVFVQSKIGDDEFAISLAKEIMDCSPR